MNRAEAYKTLRLDASAEGDMVKAAYWSLVRQAQDRSRDEPGATEDIDACNEAYAILAPRAQILASRPPPQTSEHGTGTEIIDRAVDWLSEETWRTRARWADRNPEIGVMLGVTLFLMVLALGAGASFWLVAASVLATLIAIWSPWRGVPVVLSDASENAEVAAPPARATKSRPSRRDVA